MSRCLKYVMGDFDLVYMESLSLSVICIMDQPLMVTSTVTVGVR
jgi:hypothetical protein